MSTGRAILSALAVLAVLTGCSAGSAESALNVSAASSLTEAFDELADRFEADHPGVTVTLNFAGSGSLAEQVNSGAPVDVLATASPETMATAADTGSAVDPQPFATNGLTLVVPAGNPAGVADLGDLARDDVRTAICAPEVPCGAATMRLLAAADVDVDAVTLDPDVKSVLARVVADEVDAGIVYATDARVAAGDVEQVDLPQADTVTTGYFISRILESPAPGLADEFIALVTGATGQQVLGEYGFGPA